MNLEHTAEIGILILANIFIWGVLAVIFGVILIVIVNVILGILDVIDDIRKGN